MKLGRLQRVNLSGFKNRGSEDMRDEISLMQDTFLKVWQMYMNWYTWFIGLNIFAFGWMLSQKDPNKNTVYTIALAFIMIIFISAGLCASWSMRNYTRFVQEQARNLWHGHRNLVLIRGVLAERISRTAYKASFSVLIISLLLWGAVLYHLRFSVILILHRILDVYSDFITSAINIFT